MVYFLLLPLLLSATSPSELGTEPFVTEQRTPGHIEKPFTRSPEATTMVRGKRVPFCFFYDADEWKLEGWKTGPAKAVAFPAVPSQVEEIVFYSANENLYALIIAQHDVWVPKNEIRGIVWGAAQEDFDRIRFLQEDYRTVNYLPIYFYEWEGFLAGGGQDLPPENYPEDYKKMKDDPVVWLKGWKLFLKNQPYVWDKPYNYYGYVLINPHSIVQVSVFGLADETDKKQEVIMDFLNGLSHCPTPK